MDKNMCKYFMMGQCKFGANCKFSHATPPPNQSNFHRGKNYPQGGNSVMLNQQQLMDTGMNDSNYNSPPPQNNPMGMGGGQGGKGQPGDITCRFFKKGTCNNQNCSFFHGYGTNLQYVSTQQQSFIKCIDVASISESKIITADEKSFKVWVIEPSFTCISEQKLPDGSITRLVFSINKIILGVQINNILGAKAKVLVYTDSSSFGIDCSQGLTCVYDIIEVDSHIVACGAKMIDIYYLDIPQSQLLQKASLQCKEDILSLIFLKQKFICGDRSGSISLWEPNSTTFLECKGYVKIHDGPITKVKVKNVNAESNYIITCSSDMSVKIFNFELNMTNIFSKSFGKPVIDLYNVSDFEGRGCFLVSLEGGVVVCVNESFETIFEIESKNNVEKRLAIAMNNPHKTNTIGNFLMLTDGPDLEIDVWIQEGSFVVNKPKPQHQGNPHFNPNNKNFGNNSNNNNYGGNYSNYNNNSHRGGRGNYRGGYGK